MRLYLSSFRFGNRPAELTKFVGRNVQAGVIMNARDGWPDNRKDRGSEELNQLEELGFKAEEIDLRNYFDKTADIKNLLKNFGLIWVSGGNVFVLRLAMKKSGFDKILIDSMHNNDFVYAGYSAAGCVLAPSLDAYAIVDDPKLTEAAYGLAADYSGLKILDYYFEPHYKSDHPESPAIDKEVEKLKAKGLPYKTVHDGEVLLIENSKETLLK